MRSPAGKHTVGPTTKLQHRNMLEKASQHYKCNEANLHNPEPTECSQCDGCWHCCCIFLGNSLNYGQNGDIDNRSRWFKPVSVGRHRSLLLI